MNAPQQHFKKTKDLALSLNRKRLTNWLLYNGYYPEQYVLPPKFKVMKFELMSLPHYEITNNGKIYSPNVFTPVNISFPKSALTAREYGIIHPKIYHDFVWHIVNSWELIINHLFDDSTIVYSYSFPIPVTGKKKGYLGSLRAGRMIYEFIEMAENDLVAESYKYKFILKTDISNFYPSIYTHSLSWALHGKDLIRKKRNRTNYNYLGNILDKLSQNANDGCTNGLLIGSAVSDLLSEIILSGSDKQFSEEIKKKNIDILCVRFKDDYRFLCRNEEDAKNVLKILQSALSSYNLSLSENKTKIQEIPDGLYRDWKIKYQPHSLAKKTIIDFKTFEWALLNMLQIDKTCSNTGIIDTFISELSNKKTMATKLVLKLNEVPKTMGLLLFLKQRRAKSFPSILAVIESIINTKKKDCLHDIAKDMLLKNRAIDDYDTIWVLYFIKYILKLKGAFKHTSENILVKSIQKNKQLFFNDDKNIILFDEKWEKENQNNLLYHLSIFNRKSRK